MSLSTLPQSDHRAAPQAAGTAVGSTLVACPDARPPAYQAVAGLARAGFLDRFVTAAYYKREGILPTLGRRLLPGGFDRWERLLQRRHAAEIPAPQVEPHWGYDVALAVENRLANRAPIGRRALSRRRTRGFDRLVARAIDRHRPAAAFLFSDVGSEFALPLCRRVGIASVLSMVTGDVREESARPGTGSRAIS